jgi:hypothetical protein
MAKVNFDPQGFAFIRMYVKEANTSQMARRFAKVDTGASCTTIDREWLNELGYDDNWIKSGEPCYPTLADNKVVKDCYRVVVPELQFGGYVCRNWSFITSLSVPFRFLLGTDTMRYFNWILDYRNNICTYTLQPELRNTDFSSDEKSIHAMDAEVDVVT